MNENKHIVKSGVYLTEVLDCYKDTVDTDYGEKNVYTFVLSVYDEVAGKYKTLYPRLYESEAENSEYMRMCRFVQKVFNTDYFRFEDFIDKTVKMDLTVRVSSSGKKYMKIRAIVPQNAEI